MPELPEVEAFRQVLLPLVAKEKTNKYRLRIQPVVAYAKDGRKVNPPKAEKFLSREDFELLNNQCFLTNVTRKGKLICMHLDLIQVGASSTGKKHKQQEAFIFLHMGMAGRISSPTTIHGLKSMKDIATYPPQHTHLKLFTDTAEASFSDSRKFGFVIFRRDQDEFERLAPDALSIILSGKDDRNKDNAMMFQNAVAGLTEKSSHIKKILLEQKTDDGGVVSGIGNWVADEVLYQCHIHPKQTFLTAQEAKRLLLKLLEILQTAVDCMEAREEFPKDWLFHHHWNGKKKGAKDAKGQSIGNVTVAGRTSYFVPSIQKISARTKPHKKRQAETTVDAEIRGKRVAVVTP